MSYNLEVYYKAPRDHKREAALNDQIARLGGRLDFLEEPENARGAVCLTYEFDQLDKAETAADLLRQGGRTRRGACGLRRIEEPGA